MLIDSTNEFAVLVALNTGAPGTYNIGISLDFGETQRDIGIGRTLEVPVTVSEDVESAGAATVLFQLVSGDTETIATDGSQTIHCATGAISKDDLVSGYVARLTIQQESDGGEYGRYLGVQQVTGVADLTAGVVSAAISTGVPSDKYYAGAAR